MEGCRSSGKSAIVYGEFREKCLATGVEVQTGHEGEVQWKWVKG